MLKIKDVKIKSKVKVFMKILAKMTIFSKKGQKCKLSKNFKSFILDSPV
jgi:hypothetical protein